MFYEPETPALRGTPGVEKKAVPVGQDEMDIVQVFNLLSRTGGVYHHLCNEGKVSVA